MIYPNGYQAEGGPKNPRPPAGSGSGTYTVGRVTIDRGTTARTCPQCMRGLPCTVEVELTVNPSSLSSLIGAAIKAPIYFGHQRSDSEWKREQFGDGAIQ